MTKVTECWMVTYYNELDAEFGYDPGPGTLFYGLDKAEAKSIARGLNKKAPCFMHYYAEEEPKRYW